MSIAAAADFALVAPPPGPVFHLGRWPNPFTWRQPTTLDDSRPAGGRFDAPNGDYATLYCASERYGCLLEKLAALRPTPSLEDRIDDTLAEPFDPDHDRRLVSSRFPTDALNGRVMGMATIDPSARFIDVENPRTHLALQRYGGQQMLHALGVHRIDRGAFLSPDRALTRRTAEELHALLASATAGIRYTSALDHDVECWAIWEHAKPQLHNPDIEPIDPTSPDLRRALPLLGFDPTD